MNADARTEAIGRIGEKPQPFTLGANVATEMLESMTKAMGGCKTTSDCNAVIERSRVARHHTVVFYQHRGSIFVAASVVRTLLDPEPVVLRRTTACSWPPT